MSKIMASAGEQKTSAALKEIVHKFTPAQQASLDDLFRQVESMNGQINFFLNHIVREAALPAPVGGSYKLSEDRSALVGQVSENGRRG